MNPPGDGLGKTRKKQGRCRATLKRPGAGTRRGRGYGDLWGERERHLRGTGVRRWQGADVKTEIKTKEAPVVDKAGVRAKMVVGTTIEL